jgi:hypothetical protein
MGHGNNRLNQYSITLILGNVMDKRAINLDGMDREAGKVAQP